MVDPKPKNQKNKNQEQQDSKNYVIKSPLHTYSNGHYMDV